MRKVISFATWPKKSCWRMVSRGLQIALQRGPDNWQVWSLRDAPAILRRKLSNLSMPGDPHVCSRCGGPKSHLEATVHDAGQFFECVTVTDALQAAHGVLQLTAQHTGCFHACVFRKKKKAGFLSTHSFRFLPRKFRCFDFQELFLVFAAAISVTYVSAGSRVVKLSTLSIGGIMSMIASAMVLCLSEHKWLQRRTAWVAAGFSDSLPWNEQVAALRYVDDLLQVSAMYCAGCLARVPEVVYQVPFKLAESGRAVTWIDLRLDLDPLSVSVAQKTLTIKPPWAAKSGYVRSWLCGRFARWQQVGLSKEMTAAETTRAFWELLLQGSRLGCSGLLCIPSSMSDGLLNFKSYKLVIQLPNPTARELQQDGAQARFPLRRALCAAMLPPFLQLGLLMGWLLQAVMATNRLGKNGERYRPSKPMGSGRRGDERARHPEAVQRLVLDIRTNDNAGRSRKRSRRGRPRSSSSSSSSSSRNKARKDKQEIARLKAMLAEKEAEECKREADKKHADAEAARRRELEEFKSTVLSLLPKQPPLPANVTEGMPKASFSAEIAQRAGYFVHEVADFAGCDSWEDIEARLKNVSNPKLKEMLQGKGVTDVPSSKPAVVKAVMRVLKNEFSSVQ